MGPNLRKYLVKCVRTLVYLSLLILFVVFYLFGQIKDFVKGSTTFTSNFVQMDDMPLPSLILCMPIVKPSKAEQYGYTSLQSIFYDKDEKYLKFNKTSMELRREVSFILNRDFKLGIDFFLGKSYSLHEGSNGLGSEQLIVTEIWNTQAVCYMIEPTFYLTKQQSPWFSLRVVPMEKSELNFMQDFSLQVFVASNNTWQGLYFYSWPYYHMSRLSIPFGFTIQTTVEITPLVIQFQNGIEDVAECIKDTVMQINCSRLCSPGAFNLADLPDCQSYQETNCMVNRGFYDPITGSLIEECMKPSKAVLFQSQIILSSPSDGSANESFIWFKYSTNQVEVKEEIPLLGIETLIGSIGGSLGLFLGFSCYDYISRMIGLLTKSLHS